MGPGGIREPKERRWRSRIARGKKVPRRLVQLTAAPTAHRSAAVREWAVAIAGGLWVLIAIWLWAIALGLLLEG